MPEPEFFIVFVLAGVIGTAAATIAGILFCVGVYRKSKAMKVIAAWIFGLGAVVFAPMGYLAVLWIRYWISGEA